MNSKKDTSTQATAASTTVAQTKKSVIWWILFLGIILSTVLAVSTYMLQPLLPRQYLTYLQTAEVAVIGYFIIHTFSTISYRLALAHSTVTASSIKSLVRIVGAIIVIAFIISYLAQDPVVAASISTISGLVIGFASSNLIGNAIAGLYLAITRPFRIGDRIKVFGQGGRVVDIGLLYTRLILNGSQGEDDNKDEMLVSNSSMVTTWVVLIKNSNKTDI